MEEAKEVEPNFCRCPFCPCAFCNKADLERHLAAFGSGREAHVEAYRRTHDRVEHGSAE